MADNCKNCTIFERMAAVMTAQSMIAMNRFLETRTLRQITGIAIQIHGLRRTGMLRAEDTDVKWEQIVDFVKPRLQLQFYRKSPPNSASILSKNLW